MASRSAAHNGEGVRASCSYGGHKSGLQTTLDRGCCHVYATETVELSCSLQFTTPSTLTCSRGSDYAPIVGWEGKIPSQEIVSIPSPSRRESPPPSSATYSLVYGGSCVPDLFSNLHHTLLVTFSPRWTGDSAFRRSLCTSIALYLERVFLAVNILLHSAQSYNSHHVSPTTLESGSYNTGRRTRRWQGHTDRAPDEEIPRPFCHKLGRFVEEKCQRADASRYAGWTHSNPISNIM
jgi:hypothetical protein